VDNGKLLREKDLKAGGREDVFYFHDEVSGRITEAPRKSLALNGAAPAPRPVTIEPVDMPTVFLLGDSTVTDQRWEDGASWGQMLPRFLRPEVAVANHAESGETLKSFLTGLRLAKVLSQLKAGDWVFIQFGHNDQPGKGPARETDPATTYTENLARYVDEVRAQMAPVAHHDADDGLPALRPHSCNEIHGYA